MSNISRNIKYLRNKYRLNQVQFSKIVNKKRPLVSQWENDTRSPLVEDLINMSKYFNIPMDILLDVDLSLTPIEEITPNEFEKIAKDWVKTNNMTPEEKQKFLRELSRLIDEENE